MRITPSEWAAITLIVFGVVQSVRLVASIRNHARDHGPPSRFMTPLYRRIVWLVAGDILKRPDDRDSS